MNSLTLLLLLPFVITAQEYKPTDFYGIIIYEKNRSIEYSYLNNPICETAVSYFTNLPTTREYNKNLKQELLPFEQIRTIEFIKFTDKEQNSLRHICPDCPLRKAKITFTEAGKNFPEYVFLALKQIDWKSSTMKGYEDLRTMEARFLNKITINVIKK